MNVDSTFEVDRFPSPGETVMTPDPTTGKTAAGGKGANQAVAAALLSAGTGRAGAQFVGQFGNDAHAALLDAALTSKGVGLAGCGRSATLPSGQGLVFLQPSGTVASVVVGGANVGGWPSSDAMASLEGGLAAQVAGAACVLLQREVPDAVNDAVSGLAARFQVPVYQDAGGEDRPLGTRPHLQRCAYFTPNLSELARLAGGSLKSLTLADGAVDEDAVVAACRLLQQRGARNVLVTLGPNGCLLVCEPDDGPFSLTGWDGEPGAVVRGVCCPVPHGGAAVDATGAGDCFRAAFAVALAEGERLPGALRFAAAAGACAVSKVGAVPAVPTRAEVDVALAAWAASGATQESIGSDASSALQRAAAASGQEGADARGAGAAGEGWPAAAAGDVPPKAASAAAQASGLSGGSLVGASSPSTSPNRRRPAPSECPWGMASRLNSMQARPDLWPGAPGVAGWVARQGTVQGLTLVDFNYPQHLRRDDDDAGPTGRLTVAQAQEALKLAGLAPGAVCLRYPHQPFRAGALTAPDPRVRAAAVALTIEAGEAALALGATELVIWSAFDGYDYPLQVDHAALWQRKVAGFRAVCDALPGLKVSLEFKPTDEHTRWFAVPSTGAALLLCRDVNRPNFGLTLDVGHCLAAGENPAQSASLVAADGKLFGVQLNDGYTRLGAEDGLCFASVHPHLALELMAWLVHTNFRGHCYFDTFPRNEDPVHEAARNVATAQRLWARATELLQPQPSEGESEAGGVAGSGGDDAGSSSALSSVWRTHGGLAALDLAEGK